MSNKWYFVFGEPSINSDCYVTVEADNEILAYFAMVHKSESRNWCQYRTRDEAEIDRRGLKLLAEYRVRVEQVSRHDEV